MAWPYYMYIVLPLGRHWILRSFSSGLVTLDVAQYVQDNKDQAVSLEVLIILESAACLEPVQH